MTTKLEGLADPAELVLDLVKNPAPSMPFTFKKVQEDGRIKDYPIRVKVLRLEENHAVFREAQAYAKEQGEVPQSYGDIYREAQAVELLTLALLRTEPHERPDGTSYYPPVFTDQRQLRASFTAPEMAQCLNMYEIAKAKYGAIDTFTEEEYGQWRDRVADVMKGPLFLSLLDSAHWPQLIYALAREAVSLRVQLGLPLSTSLDISESDQQSSGSGTGEFSTLPEGQDEAGEPLPTDRILTAEEARERQKTLLKPKPR